MWWFDCPRFARAYGTEKVMLFAPLFHFKSFRLSSPHYDEHHDRFGCLFVCVMDFQGCLLFPLMKENWNYRILCSRSAGGTLKDEKGEKFGVVSFGVSLDIRQ